MITVEISYRLGEYLALIREFAGYQVSAKRQRIPVELVTQASPVPIWTDLSLLIFAPPICAFKVAKLGPCRFDFDGSGLARTAKNGTINIAWGQIIRVFRLSGAD
jgi:hypothetical protein